MSACVGWRVRLPEALSPLASPCLPLPPHMCACVGWRARLPRVLSPIASPHVCLCWMVRPPSQGLVSPCLPLSICLPLSPHMGDYVGWCVRLPEVLSPLVSPHVCLCWMVWPPSRSLVSPCLPLWHMHSCVGMCSPSRGLVSPLSPHICVPVLDVVSAFASSCLPLPPIVSQCPPLLSLSPIVSPHVCLCWMVCSPSRGVPALVRIPELLSPLVSHMSHVCMCWIMCPLF